MHPVFERVFHTYDALNNVVDENLQGIRVVKSYNRESFEVSKFGRISQRIFKDFTKAERIMSFNSPLMMICIYGSMILIAWMGAQQIVASGNNPAVGLTTGDLTALVTYAMQILMAMMMFPVPRAVGRAGTAVLASEQPGQREANWVRGSRSGERFSVEPELTVEVERRFTERGTLAECYTFPK